MNKYLHSFTLGDKLSQLRSDKHKAQKEVAEAVNISTGALSSYENKDYSDMKIGTLIKLANYYDVSIPYLLGSDRENIKDVEVFKQLGLSETFYTSVFVSEFLDRDKGTIPNMMRVLERDIAFSWSTLFQYIAQYVVTKNNSISQKQLGRRLMDYLDEWEERTMEDTEV